MADRSSYDDIHTGYDNSKLRSGFEIRALHLEITDDAIDDIAKPGVCRLIVEPPQPDHTGLDRFGYARQLTDDERVGPRHTFGDVERKHRHKIRRFKSEKGYRD